MDNQEGMSMAKMAVAILLVLLVIGAVVGIVYAAYSWFSSGSDKLANNVTSISDSAMAQFDDKQVSGSDVLSALKNYRNSDVAIFVANLENEGGSFNKAVAVPSAAVSNYCALAATPVPAAASRHSYEAKALLELGATGKTYAGQYVMKNGFAYDTDGVTIKRNTNFSPTTTTGYSDTFVKQSADWYANLVYDGKTGDVCGIMFRQMN